MLLSLLGLLNVSQPAFADSPGPAQAQARALAAKIADAASRVHQLTEHIDQARLQVDSTSAQLVASTRQHDQTAQVLEADRVVLRQQAVTAYMRGGGAQGLAAGAKAMADITVGREYLAVATGNLTDATDHLRVAEADLKRQEAAVRAARQAGLQALDQVKAVRDNALAVAAQQQAQLDRISVQLQDQARVAQASQPLVASRPSAAVPAPAAAPTQGLPVNGGLIAVVKAASEAPTTSPTTTARIAVASSTLGGVWQALRQCESSGNYAANTGNGYFGAYQFSQATWTGLGYPGQPDEAPPAIQDRAAVQLQSQSGWAQWPACAAALGLI